MARRQFAPARTSARDADANAVVADFVEESADANDDARGIRVGAAATAPTLAILPKPIVQNDSIHSTVVVVYLRY